ncbi:MAG: MBL fold metallo-hydrolase [Clostridiales bacterium]|jgi:L-ascorbate metabolism protein UlaG (beta-lactamase superfamily)|nr:MBL fold metallo-hydrolase [Clostridiales bacterium]
MGQINSTNLEIYYLYNSGFSVVLENRDALIFDYYRGSLGRPWRTPLPAEPAGYRGVYVFASHQHGDHYNAEIFSWRAERPDISYILSDDIRIAADPRGITTIAEGGEAQVGDIHVRAYGSTDLGVSFHVLAGGLSIFHAGDFNYWHWTDESSAAEIAEARRGFNRVLASVKEGIPKIDVAFFPVDPRIGSDYYRGAVLFCEAMRPTLLVPMHFSQKFAPPRAFYDEITRYTKVVPVGPAAGRLIM